MARPAVFHPERRALARVWRPCVEVDRGLHARRQALRREAGRTPRRRSVETRFVKVGRTVWRRERLAASQLRRVRRTVEELGLHVVHPHRSVGDAACEMEIHGREIGAHGGEVGADDLVARPVQSRLDSPLAGAVVELDLHPGAVGLEVDAEDARSSLFRRDVLHLEAAAHVGRADKPERTPTGMDDPFVCAHQREEILDRQFAPPAERI